MSGVYGEFYLKSICLILSHGKYLSSFWEMTVSLREKHIRCEALLAEEEYRPQEETLYITDSRQVLDGLLKKGLPVVVYLHEENRKQDMSAARYAFEQPRELDVTYWERVYRRQKNIAWDILETQRCYLRETTVEDVDDFYDIYSNPEMTRYTESLYESPISEKAYVREYIEKVYHFYEFGIWTVVWKETGQVIGRAGIHVREGYDLPELGYVIGKPWQGQGVATEICRAILAYAGQELGFERLMTVIQKENRASLRLAKRLGFREAEKPAPPGDDLVLFVAQTK